MCEVSDDSEQRVREEARVGRAQWRVYPAAGNQKFSDSRAYRELVDEYDRMEFSLMTQNIMFFKGKILHCASAHTISQVGSQPAPSPR